MGPKQESDKVRQLNNFTLYDDNDLCLSLRGATLSTKLRTMVQLALMMTLKPESVGMPLGVSTMTSTADNEVNGYANIVDNSSSHPGANRTWRVKAGEAGEAAPAPTIVATKKRGIQT